MLVAAADLISIAVVGLAEHVVRVEAGFTGPGNLKLDALTTVVDGPLLGWKQGLLRKYGEPMGNIFSY